MRVEFVCSPRDREVVRFDLTLPERATLAQALRVAAADPRAAFLSQGLFDAGVWGRRQPLTMPLNEGDRVEAYRALRCDPKEARRLRFRQACAPTSKPRRRAGPAG